MNTPTAPSSCDVLITGGDVVTVDDNDRVIEQGAVAVVGERIAWVGPADDIAVSTATTVVDATGCAVLPGFVDCHTHLFQGAAKSLGDGRELWPWLCELMWPIAYELTSDEVVAAVRLAGAEAAMAGITTVMDNHYGCDDPDTIARVVGAIGEVGLRGIVARGMSGSPSPASRTRTGSTRPHNRSTADELTVTAELMDRFPTSDPVSVCPAPNILTYAEQELVAACVEMARARGSRWHTHCCETADDPRVYDETYGTTPVAWLEKEGLLGPEATLAHAICLDPHEVAAMGERQAGVAHNPLSNQYLASGTARWPEMLHRGVAVGLGTDGPACGHRMDPFETMKQAILTQRMATGDATIVAAADALRLATRGGAECLGVDAGEIVVGRLADLCVVDLGAPHVTPHHDIVAALVYCATIADVTATVVAGRLVVCDGELTTVDTRAVIEEGAARAAEVAARAGLTSSPRPNHRLEPTLR